MSALRTLARIIISITLLGVALFCVFGFLATFEPPGFPGWRIGYAAVGILCIVASIFSIISLGNSTR